MMDDGDVLIPRIVNVYTTGQLAWPIGKADLTSD